MPSIKLLPGDIPLLMHCLDVDYYSCIDSMEIDEKDIDATRDKLISSLDNNTPDVLAMEPPVPGDGMDAGDIMRMDSDDLICNILVLRSLRQRLAMLSLSTPDKKNEFEFSFHALESGILISAVEMQVDNLENGEDKNLFDQAENQYFDQLLCSLHSLYDALNSISESNRDRTSTFMKLPIGQQLTFLDQILPQLKDPAEILAGDRPKKDIDLLGVTPQSTIIGKFFGYDEPDCILQDYELNADYAEYTEDDEDDDSTKVAPIISASFIRIPDGDWRTLSEACDCRSSDMIDAFTASHETNGDLLPPLGDLKPGSSPVWVIDYLIAEPGYEDAAAPCLRWFIENVIRYDGPLLVYPVISYFEDQSIKHDKSPEALRKIREFYASMNFLPLRDTDYMYLNI